MCDTFLIFCYGFALFSGTTISFRYETLTYPLTTIIFHSSHPWIHEIKFLLNALSFVYNIFNISLNFYKTPQRFLPQNSGHSTFPSHISALPPHWRRSWACGGLTVKQEVFLPHKISCLCNKKSLTSLQLYGRFMGSIISTSDLLDPHNTGHSLGFASSPFSYFPSCVFLLWCGELKGKNTCTPVLSCFLCFRFLTPFILFSLAFIFSPAFVIAY